jgi:hypothetical protein
MIFLPCWIISPADYRQIAIAIQFTNCTASLFHAAVPADR